MLVCRYVIIKSYDYRDLFLGIDEQALGSNFSFGKVWITSSRSVGLIARKFLGKEWLSYVSSSILSMC